MPLVVYSALRLGLFAVALVVLWLVGMGGWLLVVVAAVVAAAASYLLLRTQRDAAVLWLAQRRATAADRPRFGPGAEADAAAEDAEAAGLAQPEGTGPQSASPRPSSTP